jgi:1-acyl-sn-glycerol-3-phosphate acyltransferase
MLDPLNAAEEIQTEVFFLANAGLFKNPVAGWILRKLYCIPIQRYEDTGGKPLNNKASFEQAIRHLAQGGCLYIAPEGTSYVNRRLRKLKTGTARIAFATESSHDFQLGLCILPVGLNYSDPTQFRSQLLTIPAPRHCRRRRGSSAAPPGGAALQRKAIGSLSPIPPFSALAGSLAGKKGG